MAPGRPATARAAMETQNYRVKRQVCINCANFKSGNEPADWAVKMWPNDPEKWKTRMVQKGKYCGIGKFSVKDSATCDLWKALDDPQP